MVGGERQPKTEKGKAGTLLSTSSTSLSSSADDVALLSYQPHSSCAFNSALPLPLSHLFQARTGCPPILCFPRSTRSMRNFCTLTRQNGQKLNLVAFTGLKRGRSGGAGERGLPLTPRYASQYIGDYRDQICSANASQSAVKKFCALRSLFFSPPLLPYRPVV